MVVGVFDGIGGLRLSLELLDVPVAVYRSLAILPSAKKVIKNAWLSVIDLGDVRLVDRKRLEELRFLYPRLTTGLLGAGMPCVDCTIRKAGRLGLDGPSFKLFYDLMEAVQLFETVFDHHK